MRKAVWFVLALCVGFFGLIAYSVQEYSPKFQRDSAWSDSGLPRPSTNIPADSAPPAVAEVPVAPSAIVPPKAEPAPSTAPAATAPLAPTDYGFEGFFVELPKPKSFQNDGLGSLETKPISPVDYARPSPEALEQLKRLVATLEAKPKDRAALAAAVRFLFEKGWYAEAVPYVDRFIAGGGILNQDQVIASTNYAPRNAMQVGMAPGGDGAYLRGLATLGRFEQARKLLKPLEARQPGFFDSAIYSVYLHYYEFLMEGRDRKNFAAAARALVAMHEVYPTGHYLDLDNLAMVDWVQMLAQMVQSKTRPELSAFEGVWVFLPPHTLPDIYRDLAKAGMRPTPVMLNALHPLNEEKPCNPAALIRRSHFAYARAKDVELAYQQARVAVAVAREQPNSERILLFALWNMAEFANRLGELPTEIDCVKEAQALSAKLGLEGFITNTELRAGALQEHLADDRGSLESFDRAMKRCEKFNAGGTLFRAEQAFNDAASRLGNPAIAEPTLRSLVKDAERASAGMGLRAGPYYSLGYCLSSQGKLEEAARYLDKAAQSPDPQFRSKAVLQLGRIGLMAKNPKAAQKYFEHTLEIMQELDDPDVRWQALTGLARALVMQNQVDQALQPVSQAMEIIDAQRGSVTDYHRRRTFQSNKEEPYQLAVNIALLKNNPAIAYAVAERARARTLLDTLNAEVKEAETPSIEALQRTAQGINVVVFLTTEENYIAWVVNERSSRFFKIDVKPRELSQEVGNFLLSLRRTNTDWKARAMALHKRVWAPLASALPQGERVCIIPHGVLHYLPFQALHDGTQHLIERHELFYAPSGRALAQLRARNVAPGGTMVLADPILSSDPKSPFHVTETARIRELYPNAKLITQKAASVPEFLAAINGAEKIHVSSHGFFDFNVPARSGLVFSKGDSTEVLTAERIAQLNLRNCNLVVLSACVSSVGELAGGDEVTGVTRAFQTSGATNVIGSLWPVENAATAELMSTFYLNLKSTPADPTAALTQAQRAAIRKGLTPVRWAAFEINGPGLKR